MSRPVETGRLWRRALLPCSLLCITLLSGVLWPAHAAVPQRIISMTPHITELLFAIGAGPQVIGIDDASDWPADVNHLPRVAHYQSINTERLLALRPDLVVLWDGSQRLLQTQLQQLGVSVVMLHSQHLTDLAPNLRQLGTLTGHPAQAGALAHQVEQRLLALQQQYRSRPPVRLFFQLWNPPLTTIARGGWVQEAVELCGGDNPFAHSITAYPQVDVEQVIRSAPQLIVTVQNAAALAAWQQWPMLPAVQHHQLKTLSPDRLQRLTPRILDGIDELCRVMDGARTTSPR